jgi:hypothetical protein
MLRAPAQAVAPSRVLRAAAQQSGMASPRDRQKGIPLQRLAGLELEKLTPAGAA